MTPTLRASLVAILAGVAGAACTTTRAAAPVERPTLEVPPPPPRVVVPLPPQPEPNQLEPVQNLGSAPVTLLKSPTQRGNPNSKVEPKPEEPKPAEPPPVAPPVQEPAAVPQLRLPESSDSPQVGQIVEVIRRAREILNKVPYGPLAPAAKKAYNESKLFADQADDALKNNNLALAREFADKAERLAKQLQG